MRTLHLTSPLMEGDDVRELQFQLIKNEVYPGTVDGKYGEITAQGVYRYKYRIGYAKPDHSAGDLVMAYLTGKKEPNLAMKALAKLRAGRKAKSAGWREKVVQHALSQLGETEHPANSNRSKFSEWYGVIGAWCAMFVTWVFASLGYAKATFIRARRYSYVPYIEGDARAGHNGLMRAAGPADAVIPCYDWDKDGVADHTGICATEATIRKYAPAALAAAIKEFGPLGKDDFWAIEGNTAVGNDSNGGITMIRKRNRSNVRVFVKVASA